MVDVLACVVFGGIGLIVLSQLFNWEHEPLPDDLKKAGWRND